jgi:hypothetical protein
MSGHVEGFSKRVGSPWCALLLCCYYLVHDLYYCLFCLLRDEYVCVSAFASFLVKPNVFHSAQRV